MIRRDVAMRGEAQINHAVRERQRRPIVLQQRIETKSRHRPRPPRFPARSPRSSRTVRLLEAGGDIECVKLLLIAARPQLDLGHHVQRSSVLGRSITGVAVIPMIGVRSPHPRSDDGTAVIPSTGSIKLFCQSAGPALIGVECIDTVVFGRDVYDVVRPLVRDRLHSARTAAAHKRRRRSCR